MVIMYGNFNLNLKRRTYSGRAACKYGLLLRNSSNCQVCHPLLALSLKAVLKSHMQPYCNNTLYQRRSRATSL
jgi:hypothetical protein